MIVIVNMENDNIKIVLTKYVPGGKEIVKYNTLTGECTLVLIKRADNKEIIKKEFKVLTN
jgi:hypothetical protein